MADSGVSFDSPPPAACWQHRGVRSGFEVAYFASGRPGWHVEGTTTGLQDDDIWVVSYQLELEPNWSTRRARVTTRTRVGSTERLFEADGAGHWAIDGTGADHLDGCLDVDLEASALTNALPVHRLALAVGQTASSPAAYVRLPTAAVERLDQLYTRVDDDEVRRLRGARLRFQVPSRLRPSRSCP